MYANSEQKKLGQIKNNVVDVFSIVIPFLVFLDNHTVSYLPVRGGGNGQKIFHTYHVSCNPICCNHQILVFD